LIYLSFYYTRLAATRVLRTIRRARKGLLSARLRLSFHNVTDMTTTLPSDRLLLLVRIITPYLYSPSGRFPRLYLHLQPRAKPEKLSQQPPRHCQQTHLTIRYLMGGVILHSICVLLVTANEPICAYPIVVPSAGILKLEGPTSFRFCDQINTADDLGFGDGVMVGDKTQRRA
jgi:hypothetical protein